MNTKMKKAETNRPQKQAQTAHSSSKQGRSTKRTQGGSRYHEQELIETRMFD